MMRFVLIIIFVTSPSLSFAQQNFIELQQRYLNLSLKNKLLSSSVLLPDLQVFISQTSNDIEKVAALQIMSEIYLEYDSYFEAIKALDDAEQLAKKLDSTTKASVLLSQAKLSLALEKYNEAIDQVNKCIEATKNSNKSLFVKSLILKGRLFYYKGSFRQSIKQFYLVKGLVAKNTRYFNLASIYSAQIALELGDKQQAKQVLDGIELTSLNLLSEDKQLVYQVILTRLNMQSVHFKTAIEQGKKLLNYTLGTRFLNLQAQLQYILSKAYLQADDYQQAFLYLQRYTLTTNALALKKRNNKLLQLEIIHNLARKQQRIVLLEKESILTKAKLAKQAFEKKQLQSEQEIQFRKWLLLSILAIIISLILYYLWQRDKVFKRLETLVKTRRQELETKNRLLEKLSNTDSLTGLYNRHYLHATIDTELANVRRRFYKGQEQQYLVAMLVDIDYFKNINDSYGHTVGDTVLQQVSNTLKNNIRGSDLLVRWGGEEFLIILKECELKQVHSFAENLRKNIENKTITINGNTDQKIKLTCSIGYSHYPFNENQRNAWVGFTFNKISNSPEQVISDINTAIKNQEVNVNSNIKNEIKFK
ncbi:MULTISPECIES: GGDEF domain-containing protein [unclassified Pseudoalteromonas]|uniref:tetratricopeptide repeat-containing diguanylate cyclase n=1 Tax=unclassified Pseudoalteromonas TaxID=194690 RepID=UPI0005A6322E|nr:MULTISPECIES: GGDEF domain-containing protein [unclassified Pseudoalteromonas]